MSDGEREVLLGCFLWAHAKQQQALSAYEAKVLALVPEHGGIVLQRMLTDGAEGRPDEIQFYRFPNRGALDSYLADPRRAALAQERDQAVARTDLFPIEPA